MEGRVLALDLATATGFAIGSVAEGVLIHGTRKFHDTDHGARFSCLFDWLNGRIADFRVAALIFEQPIMIGGRDSTNVVRPLMTMAGIAEMCGHRSKCEVFEVAASQWRKHFLPPQIVKPKGRAAMKSATIAECRARGWNPVDDNAADALAILDFALEHFHPGYSPPVWALRPRGMNKARAA